MCAGCRPPQPFVTSDRMQRGLVVVLPGIEGRGYLNEQICRGLADGGVNWAIEIDDWTSSWGPLYNLRSEKRNRRKAGDLVERIKRYRVAFPERPVVLLGHSGGGAIAIWASEMLGKNDKVKGVILINVAISREYDLAKALEHTTDGIINYYSGNDWVLLGLGTTVYGTMDGKHGSSAGKEKFLAPTDLPQAYRKLYQVGWDMEMIKTGHLGGHFSSSSTRFVSRYVAPLVMAEQWSEQLVKNIKSHDINNTTDSPVETPGILSKSMDK